MTPELHSAATTLEKRLQTLTTDATQDSYARSNAEEYLERISSLRKYLESNAYSAVLIGARGSGKSVLLSALTGLTLGERPSQQTQVPRWTVLPVGPGGTTVCTIRIRNTNDADCPNRDGAEYGLTLVPLEDDETSLQIDLFAEAIWALHRDRQTMVDDEAGEALDAEKERIVRGLTNCSRKRNPNQSQPADDPARTLAEAATDLDDLKATLKQMAQLQHRNKTEWWPTGSREDCLAFLKQKLFDINFGRESTAPYPKVITLWIPRDEHSTRPFDIAYTDSKGFDGKLESRSDLQEMLRNDRCVYLLCTRFQDTPGDVFRAFLKTVQRINGLAQASERIRILIMDLGHAESVPAADGDRLFGQQLRHGDCVTNLSVHNLGDFAGRQGERVLAFDTLQDDLASIRQLIDDAIERQRVAKIAAMKDAIEAATEVLANLQTEEKAVMQEVDRLLLEAFKDSRPSVDRLDDVVSGVIDLLSEHPARVRAMCRRDGEYLELNAYAAVEISVQEWFQRYYRDLDTAMQTTFRALERDVRFERVANYVKERHAAYADKKTATGQRIASLVSRELRRRMPREGVWIRSSEEWRQGQGFRDRVRGHIESFGSSFQEKSPALYRFTPQDFGLPAQPEPV